MRVFCILSDERAFRSKSPRMHNAVLRTVGIDGIYVPFAVRPEDVGDALRGLAALNIGGANVTVPYKETVIPYLDSLADDAATIGAVNTIVPHEQRLIGHNTDAAGFADMLASAQFDASGKSVLVFGTGGAAKAVLYALKRLAARKIVLAGRSTNRTEELARAADAEPVTIDSLQGRPIAVDLVVNTTAVSAPAEGPDLSYLVHTLEMQGCGLMVDINYGRPVSFWQDKAASESIPFIDGLSMLAHQARWSFLLWTGVKVDVEPFLSALRENV